MSKASIIQQSSVARRDQITQKRYLLRMIRLPSKIILAKISQTWRTVEGDKKRQEIQRKTNSNSIRLKSWAHRTIRINSAIKRQIEVLTTHLSFLEPMETLIVWLIQQRNHSIRGLLIWAQLASSILKLLMSLLTNKHYRLCIAIIKTLIKVVLLHRLIRLIDTILLSCPKPLRIQASKKLSV